MMDLAASRPSRSSATKDEAEPLGWGRSHSNAIRAHTHGGSTTGLGVQSASCETHPAECYGGRLGRALRSTRW